MDPLFFPFRIIFPPFFPGSGHARFRSTPLPPVAPPLDVPHSLLFSSPPFPSLVPHPVFSFFFRNTRLLLCQGGCPASPLQTVDPLHFFQPPMVFVGNALPPPSNVFLSKQTKKGSVVMPENSPLSFVKLSPAPFFPVPVSFPRKGKGFPGFLSLYLYPPPCRTPPFLSGLFR